MPASALGPVPIPLTAGQKLRLLAGCVPLILFALVVAGYLILVGRDVVPPPAPLLSLVIVAAILVMAYKAFQGLRDLFSGVALVQEDLLDRSWAGRSAQGRSSYFGKFERLGTLQLIPKAHFQNSPGRRYRVVYSPASKIVWALEPPDLRIR